jgi:hypothetical protein
VAFGRCPASIGLMDGLVVSTEFENFIVQFCTIYCIVQKTRQNRITDPTQQRHNPQL